MNINPERVVTKCKYCLHDKNGRCNSEKAKKTLGPQFIFGGTILPKFLNSGACEYYKIKEGN